MADPAWALLIGNKSIRAYHDPVEDPVLISANGKSWRYLPVHCV